LIQNLLLFYCQHPTIHESQFISLVLFQFIGCTEHDEMADNKITRDAYSTLVVLPTLRE
jgi:hypothetical protein